MSVHGQAAPGSICAFDVTANGEEEVLEHVLTHKADSHVEKDVNGGGIHEMKSVEIRQRP